MDCIDKYFENNKIIYYNDIINKFIKYYNNSNDLMLDVNFLLNTLHTDVSIIEKGKSKRYKQEVFRKKVIERYKSCIVTGALDEAELEAAHIIPHKDVNSCDLDNGILLNRMIHKTFDNYNWSINPKTLKIEINKSTKDKRVSSILLYENKKIKIENSSITYLHEHYHKFLSIK